MPIQIFQKQAMMRKVIYSLIPIYLFSAFLYGFRLLLLSLIVFSAGIIIEFITEKLIKKKKVTEAIFITCALFTLSLSPKTPWWVALIGISFGVLFGKEVFGGFGKNIFNPAIAGRLFIYISFPNEINTGWTKIGNFGFVDSVTAATPLKLLDRGINTPIFKLLLGWHPGSMGESMILLILLAAVFLIFTKTASWEIIISMIGSALLLTFILDISGIPKALPTLQSMFSGSLIFVAVFMATDPISAPKKRPSKFIYGILLGSVTIIIRTFSITFIEGTSFAVLIGNMFAPLLDEITTKIKVKK